MQVNKCKCCGYQYGWVYLNDKPAVDEEPEWVEGSHGDFYKLRAGFSTIVATRHGGADREVIFCPKCSLSFIV